MYGKVWVGGRVEGNGWVGVWVGGCVCVEGCEWVSVWVWVCKKIGVSGCVGVGI